MIELRAVPCLAVLVAVVDQGSFTAAARALGLSKSVVSDRVPRFRTQAPQALAPGDQAEASFQHLVTSRPSTEGTMWQMTQER
jgi:DNA-binding transcriptional LysR family regulator